MNPFFTIPTVYGSAFTHEIIKHVMLNTSAKEKNLVFSPYLILASLSQIAAAGSKGSVLEKMLSHVNSGSAHEKAEFCSEFVREMFSDWNRIGGTKVWFCTSAWIDKSLPVDPVFKNAVETLYEEPALKQVDFRKKAKKAAAKMNVWAEEATDGQIRKAFPPSAVNGSTRLAFLNATYFKGVWMRKIDPADTEVGDFHLLDGSSVRVPFMTSKTRQYIGVCKGFKLLRLSYYCGTRSGSDSGRISMSILLPDSKYGFPSLVRNFCADALFLDRLPIQLLEIGKLKIPRFKIAFGFEACQTLRNLAGSLLPPSSSSTAEDQDSTTKMTDDGSTSATRIIHSAVLEINEESKGASAETEWLLANICPAGKVDFVADHPFMFVIRDDESVVTMLTGHVLNPLVS